MMACETLSTGPAANILPQLDSRSECPAQTRRVTDARPTQVSPVSEDHYV